jgi:subtilase family serine protease
MVYDPARGRVVLFGGQDATGNFLGDTWEWDTATATWTDLTPPGGPSPRARSAFGMAYDRARARTVIYGGYIARNPNDPFDVGIAGDTWEWDGQTWTHVATADGFIFVGLWGPELAYDPNLGRVILFGGQTYFAENNALTYAFDGVGWSVVATTGPTGRTRHAMATDLGRSRVVLFGGAIYSGGAFPDTATQDTWEWDGAAWTEVTPAGPRPPARTGAALTYAASRGAVQLFGGNPTASAGGFAAPTLQDTWEWDGTFWTSHAGSPSARWSAMAFDESASRTVLFGGNQQRGPSTYFSFSGGGGGAGSLDDTWILATAQSITFGPLADRTFGDPPFVVSAVASSGLPVTFAAAGACTVAGATVTLTGAGTCTVTASQPGGAGYSPAPSVEQTFAIARASQTIAFDPLPDRTLGEAPFTVSAAATSGLPVSFSANGPCSVSGDLVALTAAGACTITASQPGNDDYMPASPVVQSFSIGLANDQDLLATAVTSPPGALPPGASFAVTDTVLNQGGLATGASTTRYYLSADTLRDAADRRLTGNRGVPGLASGVSSTGTVTVTAPATVPLGVYFLLACADDLTAVNESNETNNCIASSTTVQVTRPDLVATAVSDPPLTASPGSAFPVTDSVTNQGVLAAGTSTTRYYLSSDTVLDASDRRLTGTRAAAALAPNETSTGTLTVTIPTSTALGVYYLLACADDTTAVTETNELNNCLASATTVQIGRPDLVVSSMSEPPSLAAPGNAFPVSDATFNQGALATGAPTTTRYYLSLNGSRSAGDRLLTGTRAVPALAAGATSVGTVTVTIPGSTPLATYFLLACADDAAPRVTESDETNNCAASTTTIQLSRPDLTTIAVDNPPATAAPGSTFTVTDTVRNQGLVAGGASTTRYYLSADALKSGTDRRLNGSRGVPILNPGVDSTGTTTVTIPGNMAPGTYFLLACADDTTSITEIDEANNCGSSAAVVQVTP